VGNRDEFSWDSLRELPELYQNIEVGGELLVRGVRNCESRYLLMKPFLHRGVWFDVGSNFGYFSRSICKDFPGSTVYSFESDSKILDVQRWLIKRENLVGEVVPMHLTLSVLNFGYYLTTYKPDGILWLSVLQYFSVEDVGRFLEMPKVGKMFVELPNPDERTHYESGGVDPRKTIRELGDYESFLRSFGEVSLLGSTTGSLEPLPRNIYLVEKRI